MNDSSTNQNHLPTESEFRSAWVQAGQDLGISVESPFTLRSPEGEFVLTAFIRDFGSPLGTLVLTAATPENHNRSFAAAQTAGYFVSILADSYAHFDRQLFIDTLDDWEYFSAHQPPSWYSGTPWS